MGTDPPTTDEEFRASVRAWLAENLAGEFAPLAGRGGPGREHELVTERMAWERRLGEAGWIGLGWPVEDGGRGLPWAWQAIFHQEYARAAGPGRIGHMSEQLLGPALLTFGTPEQKARFLPGILSGTQIWCQGYSEPDAGSDLAAVRTRAELRDGEWHLHGQKVWTSLAHIADWCFALARTDPHAERHRGLSYLLVPMRQPGVTIRPIRQLTGTSEFNEVFFDDARTDASAIIGAPGDGWRVAMSTLGVERGVSTIGQQAGFQREFEEVLAQARRTGAIRDPETAGRLTDAWIGLQVMRHAVAATLGGAALGGGAAGGGDGGAAFGAGAGARGAGAAAGAAAAPPPGRRGGGGLVVGAGGAGSELIDSTGGAPMPARGPPWPCWSFHWLNGTYDGWRFHQSQKAPSL